MSPLVFIIVMEYFNRQLHKMQRDPNFNHHAKCEKLHITNLTFTDDVLMFAREDYRSLELMMKALNEFSMSIGLIVNPRKCRIYFGGVDENTKDDIKKMTTFME